MKYTDYFKDKAEEEEIEYKEFMEKTLRQRFKRPFSSRISDFFEGLRELFLILILSIFNPFTILAGGIIAIIILLIVI